LILGITLLNSSVDKREEEEFGEIRDLVEADDTDLVTTFFGDNFYAVGFIVRAKWSNIRNSLRVR